MLGIVIKNMVIYVNISKTVLILKCLRTIQLVNDITYPTSSIFNKFLTLINFVPVPCNI